MFTHAAPHPSSPNKTHQWAAFRGAAGLVFAALVTTSVSLGAMAAAEPPLSAVRGVEARIDPRFEDMPEPEAFAQPDPARANGTVSHTATETLSASSIELSAGSHRLFGINTTTGKVSRGRTVQFPTSRVFRTPDHLGTFNGKQFARIDDGPYAGRWVRATASTVGTVPFSPPEKAQLNAGTHVGIRFYTAGRQITRSLSLSDAAIYEVSATATIGGTSYLYLATGPLANRWVAQSTAADLIRPTDPDPPVTRGAPATWKAVLLVYRDTDVTFTAADGSVRRLRTRMSDSMYDLSIRVARRTVAAASGWSDSYAALDLTIVDVPRPVTKLDSLWGGYWVGPAAIKSDLDAYAPTGTYDSVFVLWQANDSAGTSVPVGGWGLSLPPGAWSNGAGYSSITTPAHEWWWTDASVPEEVFIHEWMHQVLFFHQDGGRLVLDLHAEKEYGYTKRDGSFKHWLSDVMRGRVSDGSKLLGVTYEIWRTATPTRPNGW